MNSAKAMLVALALASSACAQTSVTKAPFGKLPSGDPVDVYTLTDSELTVKIINYGAHIISVQAPDRAGAKADVVLGYDSLAGYLADDGKTYMGSVVGRYGNRIAKGAFTLEGKKVQVDVNSKGQMLHGGARGFDRMNWTGKQIRGGVELKLVSKDGDMGFPGTLTAHVRYTLAGDKLRMTYSATTDKPTVINLTNHTYFNLAGSGDILSHLLTLSADRFTPVDSDLITTGQLAPVAGTPFDFRKATPIGARMNQANEQLKLAGGYDHNWVLNAPHTLMKAAAVLVDPGSGRTLKVFTTEPGVQFYTGNFLDGTMKGRAGTGYAIHSGLCLETQHYPDSPNHPDFPTTTLLPGHTYNTTTIFQFTR
jgi:aldose 1-epimerase